MGFLVAVVAMSLLCFVVYFFENRSIKKEDARLRKRFEEVKDEHYSVTAIIYLRDNTTITHKKEFTSYLHFGLNNMAYSLYRAKDSMNSFIYDLERSAKHNGLKIEDVFYTPANIMKIEYIS